MTHYEDCPMIGAHPSMSDYERRLLEKFPDEVRYSAKLGRLILHPLDYECQWRPHRKRRTRKSATEETVSA